MTLFTIEDAKRVQRDLGLLGVHVVYYNPEEGWSMAHAQAERDAGMDLSGCLTHKWMIFDPGLGYDGPCTGCFPQAGWYEIRGFHAVKGLAL